jgi:hypothetical protein
MNVLESLLRRRMEGQVITDQHNSAFDDDYCEEILVAAAAITLTYMAGCRCDSCWEGCEGLPGGVAPGRDHHPCVSASAAEMIRQAVDAALAIDKRRRCDAPLRIDSDPTYSDPAYSLLHQPRVWETVERVTEILTHGVTDANEPMAIAMLLRGARLPLLEGKRSGPLDGPPGNSSA